MAIIYSYPDNENLLLTDMLIGTSTISVNGRKKNITKNFTLESLGMFISENFPATEIAWGNITGNLSNQTDLQDALDAKQANITLTTTGTSGLATFIGSTLNIPDYGSGYVTPTLQSVTDEGNTTTNDIVVDSALYESIISNNSISVSTKTTAYGVGLLAGGVISFGNGSAYSYLSSSVSNLNVYFNLPNKVSGTYTLATTADIPASLLVALPFTADHLTATNNAYVIGDVVWYLGNVYRCIANNDSILPTAPLYWTNLGAGNPLVAQPSNWNATSGNNQILNKPTIPDVSGFVPYIGATQDVDLGEFEIKAGQVEFDQTPTGTAGVGVMRWNDSDGTVDLGLKGGNVTLQIGQEQVLRVVNKTATNVNLLEANYQAVRVTGAQGQRLKVDLAQATNDPLSAETLGLVTETINNNQEGFITTSGLVRGINTTGSLQGETWADGDILYLSPTTAGNATKVKPTAPNHLIILGYVIHAHITQGSIFVKVDNGYELDELHNVKITTPANRDVLTYTSATDIWENTSFYNLAVGGVQYFNDFDSSFTLDKLQSVVSGGTTIRANAIIANQTSNQVGICTYATSTAATNYAMHISESNSSGQQFQFGGGTWLYESYIAVETLSNVTNRFRFQTGFGDLATASNDNNGAIIIYDEGGTANGTIASANWQCVTSNNGVRTLTTTSVPVTTNWVKLRIIVNADATSITYFIDGSLVATHTTNIPTYALGRRFKVKQGIFKTIGTTNRNVNCDYLFYENNLTTLR